MTEGGGEMDEQNEEKLSGAVLVNKLKQEIINNVALNDEYRASINILVNVVRENGINDMKKFLQRYGTPKKVDNVITGYEVKSDFLFSNDQLLTSSLVAVELRKRIEVQIHEHDATFFQTLETLINANYRYGKEIARANLRALWKEEYPEEAKQLLNFTSDIVMFLPAAWLRTEKEFELKGKDAQR
jgi:hypothetical protein